MSCSSTTIHLPQRGMQHHCVTQHRRRHPPTRRCSISSCAANGDSTTDTSFWAQLEEQDFGRVTSEADHLFDTSYAWT